MKRRYSRKPKRTFKRTRRFRKRSFKRKVSKYDGIIRRKIVQSFFVAPNAATGADKAAVAINWASNLISADFSSGIYNNDIEHYSMCQLHTEARIYGLKMEFRPVS